ncbi:ATP-dependent nuclease [Aeromonas allosaccharophila]|uniref:ATP-dependent nuclease n=1 Tax=Aeromonas allosaccharophila TaxID=656 RepID=UPI0009E531AC|nr:ATP-binding protein [Aeromonas allosaccharophila]
MKIDSIKLSGWRSYDLDGVLLEGLKSINLIIGPNNSGKSNLSKYFNYLKSVYNSELLPGKRIIVKANLDESQTWHWGRNQVECQITLSKENVFTKGDNVSYKPDSHNIMINCQHNLNTDTSILNIKVNDLYIFNESDLICYDLKSPRPIWRDPIDIAPGFNDNKFYWEKFLRSLVFVDPIRHHSRNSKNQQSYYFDGAQIISELDRLRTDKATPSNWSNYKRQMKTWLSDILSESVTNIEIIDDDLYLEFQSGLSFSLDKLGTGVSQIVMLLSHLWINKESYLNVFLEEPEANLHPEAVVRLVKIFESELVNHRFFITTHSPSLIDCLNINWSVYRTLKGANGASLISPNDNIVKHYETLDSLGVKASQILQANTVIWVEGPSDRIYINKWIELFSDGTLQEGKDYSFLYFGGTNLASFTALDDPDNNLINILSTSRKAYLIADSDCSSPLCRDNDAFKAYLSSMLERLDSVNKDNTGLHSSIKDYIKIWITDGREIENYLSKELFFTVLTSPEFKRSYIGKGEQRKTIKLIPTDPSDFVFDKFSSFDMAIAKYYQDDSDMELIDPEINNIALSYANKKVQIAKAVSKVIKLTDCKTFDLAERMAELISFIKK